MFKLFSKNFLMVIGLVVLFLAPLTHADQCSDCGDWVVVNGNVTINFNNDPPTYSGDPALEPYFGWDKSGGATADKWKAIFNLGNKRLLVKSGATITVNTVPLGTNNRRSPGIDIFACQIDIEEGGAILVNSHNQPAGDLFMQAQCDVNIDGLVKNWVTGTNGFPGKITIVSCCGNIYTGPKSWIETVGVDHGGSDINLVTCEDAGNIEINGLVRAMHKYGPTPTINVLSFGGWVKIDGNNDFGQETIRGGIVRTTSGVVVRTTHATLAGNINIQAKKDIKVLGNILLSNRVQYGAVAVKSHNVNGQGGEGEIFAVSLEGKIIGIDRAFDIENRFNAFNKLSLHAKSNIQLSVTNRTNFGASDNTKAVVSSQGGDVGKGGTNTLKSYSGGIIIGENAQVLADYTGRPGSDGTNLLISCSGITNDGAVIPADADNTDDFGVCVPNAPDAIFANCDEFSIVCAPCTPTTSECIDCDGDVLEVNSDITIDFNTNPPTYNGDAVLQPYFTYDNTGATADTWKAIFNVGAKKLVIKDGATISTSNVPLGTNNRHTPGIEIHSTCELVIEEGGAVIVSTLNRNGGNILINVDGDIIIAGEVTNEQRGTNNFPGAITIYSKCGDIDISGLVQILGTDFGGRTISIIACGEDVRADITISGLVKSFAHAHGVQTPETRPNINVVAFNGGITINANTAEPLYDEFQVGGSTYDIYGGLLAWTRDNVMPGTIKVQAKYDIVVNGHGEDPTPPVRRSFGAIAAVGTASNQNSGIIDVRSLEGSIIGNDRAFDVGGRNRGSYQMAEVRLHAAIDVILSRPGSDNTFNPVIDARDRGNDGTAGDVTIRAYTGQIIIGANALIDATPASSNPGTLLFTHCTGYINNGTVQPAPTVNNLCAPIAPAPLFLDCNIYLAKDGGEGVEEYKHEAIIPEKTQLIGNYPNPFNPYTTIVFQIDNPKQVSLVIFDILGREIRTLLSGDHKEIGQHSILWNGRDNYGRVVPSGTYFYQFRAGETVQSGRMIFLK